MSANLDTYESSETRDRAIEESQIPKSSSQSNCEIRDCDLRVVWLVLSKISNCVSASALTLDAVGVDDVPLAVALRAHDLHLVLLVAGVLLQLVVEVENPGLRPGGRRARLQVGRQLRLPQASEPQPRGTRRAVMRWSRRSRSSRRRAKPIISQLLHGANFSGLKILIGIQTIKMNTKTTRCPLLKSHYSPDFVSSAVAASVSGAWRRHHLPRLPAVACLRDRVLLRGLRPAVCGRRHLGQTLRRDRGRTHSGTPHRPARLHRRNLSLGWDLSRNDEAFKH